MYCRPCVCTAILIVGVIYDGTLLKFEKAPAKVQHFKMWPAVIKVAVVVTILRFVPNVVSDFVYFVLITVIFCLKISILIFFFRDFDFEWLTSRPFGIDRSKLNRMFVIDSKYYNSFYNFIFGSLKIYISVYKRKWMYKIFVIVC